YWWDVYRRGQRSAHGDATKEITRAARGGYAYSILKRGASDELTSALHRRRGARRRGLIPGRNPSKPYLHLVANHLPRHSRAPYMIETPRIRPWRAGTS